MHEKGDMSFVYIGCVDDTGIADGIDMALEMVGDAMNLLAPYADNCPACTVEMFTEICERAIETRRKQEEPKAIFFDVSKEPNQEQRYKAHFERVRLKVAEIKRDHNERKGGASHTHH